MKHGDTNLNNFKPIHMPDDGQWDPSGLYVNERATLLANIRTGRIHRLMDGHEFIVEEPLALEERTVYRRISRKQAIRLSRWPANSAQWARRTNLKGNNGVTGFYGCGHESDVKCELLPGNGIDELRYCISNEVNPHKGTRTIYDRYGMVWVEQVTQDEAGVTTSVLELGGYGLGICRLEPVGS